MNKLGTYRRPVFNRILARIRERRRFMQVLAGPRQVGKSTLARQVIEASGLASRVASADEPTLRDRTWLAGEWELARALARENRVGLLVLDEIQKVSGWSEAVKRLWDEDTAKRVALRVMLLGSAPLLIQRGLTESLGGRFELIRIGHWSLREMRDAFGWSLEQYLYYGGYPGAAPLIADHERWASYIKDSLIETTISRDVLLLTRVDKPALLRQLFRLACDYSGQIVTLTKLMGQLQDAGNVTTLAHYLDLLGGAGMVAGLSKYSGSQVRRRGSSPKLVVLNNALVTATTGITPADAKTEPETRGRLVETVVGAHLLSGAESGLEVFYWREGDVEVDYVVRSGRSLFAIEVKSGRVSSSTPGLSQFAKEYRNVRPLLVGEGGIELEEFLLNEPNRWLT
ncbi:MAG TPA: ATP-binding protein [Candidatus Limnocylindria bacterium]|nr:ATP-binding protein [Candidatus Limnocylindria bacterium]